MANARLNIFENYPVANYVTRRSLIGANTLHINYVFIPGSISFNNVALLLMQTQSNIGQTFGASFGLYSLNGATLSLANSAAASRTATSGGEGWMTLATSATQDITPGDWYFAVKSSTAGYAGYMFHCLNAKQINSAYLGPFYRGWFSVSTGDMPASIATSDMVKEGSSSPAQSQNYPYILISA